MLQSGFKVDELWENAAQFIAADHPDLYYIGRIDHSAPATPVFTWQGSEVRGRFSGSRLGLRFVHAWGQNCFNVIVDNQIHLLQLTAAETQDYWLELPLALGEHEFAVFKRTEALFGHAAFAGLYLEQEARMLPKPAPLPLRFEFYGDSITAGACNEDPGMDQYDDLSTHNNYLAYGAITARALNAEYVCIAVSGTGLCYSWNPIMIQDVYDKVNLEPDSPRADFNARQPDLVVINLGQNDHGFPLSEGMPFPSDYTERYLEFVRNLRDIHPEARIICALGGMPAYQESAELRAAYGRAMRELTAADSKIHPLVFNACTPTHPRVDTHLKLAAELTEFIRREILVK